MQVRQRIAPRSPLLARIYTGFVDPSDSQLTPLPATDQVGSEIEPFVAEAVLLPWSAPEVAETEWTLIDARFGETIGLAGMHQPETVSAGQTLTVTLLWQATAAPGIDYTAFVHLLDNSGTSVAGYDAAPGGTRFPTRVWAAGDQILSEMVVALPEELPPGDYSTWLGLYEAGSVGAARLPVQEAGGHATAHEMIELGSITVAHR